MAGHPTWVSSWSGLSVHRSCFHSTSRAGRANHHHVCALSKTFRTDRRRDGSSLLRIVQRRATSEGMDPVILFWSRFKLCLSSNVGILRGVSYLYLQLIPTLVEWSAYHVIFMGFCFTPLGRAVSAFLFSIWLSRVFFSTLSFHYSRYFLYSLHSLYSSSPQETS
jgi:hypothetical protein